MYTADDKIVWKNINKDDEEEIMETHCVVDAQMVASSFNTVCSTRDALLRYLLPDSKVTKDQVIDELLMLFDKQEVVELVRRLES